MASSPGFVVLTVAIADLAQPSWSLEATVALIHTQTQGITIGPVRSLPLWLDHLPPELDAFVRLQEQGVSFEEVGLPRF